MRWKREFTVIWSRMVEVPGAACCCARVFLLVTVEGTGRRRRLHLPASSCFATFRERKAMPCHLARQPQVLCVAGESAPRCLCLWGVAVHPRMAHPWRPGTLALQRWSLEALRFRRWWYRIACRIADFESGVEDMLELSNNTEGGSAQRKRECWTALLGLSWLGAGQLWASPHIENVETTYKLASIYIINITICQCKTPLALPLLLSENRRK